MSELITVIIPVFKTERYLEKCVNSIRSQSYQNLEIILVDDGSPDNSGALCDQLASEDPRIKVIHKQNGGLSDARNSGLEAATGSFICFCDSDDWMETDILEAAVREIKESKADLLIWSYSYDTVDEYETLIRAKQCTANGIISLRCTDLFEENNTQVLLGFAWNKLYKTKIIKDGGFRFPKGISLVEDILFNSQIFCCCDRVRMIDTIGTHYMQRKRATLGNIYYKNYSNLICMAIEAKKRMMNHFEYPYEATKMCLSNYIMRALKVGVVTITRDIQINDVEKYHRMKAFLSEENTFNLVNQVEGSSLKEKVLLFLMRIKASILLIKLV